MDSMTPLWQTHDVSQALQDKLELMPGVDVRVQVPHC